MLRVEMDVGWRGPSWLDMFYADAQKGVRARGRDRVG